MKRLFALLPLTLAFVAACSATPDAIKAAKKGAEDRGFYVLSTTSAGGDPVTEEWVDVEVSFGEGGCTGRVRFQGDTTQLTTDLPMPGNPMLTTQNRVDDPTVEKLREITAFRTCFTVNASQPTG